MSNWPLYPFFRYSLLLLLLLSCFRLAFIVWQYDRVQSLENAMKLLGFGIRFDVILICYLWFIPALLLLLLPENMLLNNLFQFISQYWFSITTVLIIFMEISTPAFIDQFDTRPNRLFFEYLETPVEVIKTSLMEYPWHFVAASILLIPLVMYLVNFNVQIYSDVSPIAWWLRIILLPVLFIVLLIGGRSSFDHRPANSSVAAFTNDQLVNKLGLSSTYTVLEAAVNLRNEESNYSAYGNMDDAEIVSIVREHSGINPQLFVDDPLSTWHQQNSPDKNKPNLVIILEESLGAGFSAKLGGVGVTPELDKLSDQGLWFTNLYAIGTRSARGIEAVVSGFPPSPSRSVLKLGLAQQHFPTVASILKQHDYNTQFIYGGESHFDNMAGFFLANGFDKVTDENDYPDASFRGTWGISDEDLLDRVDEQLLNGSDKPQFILAFTSSNHSPFQFPDGKIELHDTEKATVNNAVKYADYALGQFFNKARKQAYWDNTYFVVVADHDTRVFGASLVPINKFHIPGLIIGPGIKPAEYTPLASQIDLLPTILNLMGISNAHPLIGHDLTALDKDFAGRAMMQYDDNHAYILGDQVIIHVPEKEPKQFSYINGELIEGPVDETLAKVAKAHALWPMFAYRQKKYLTQ
jgi:phosphoglycerol transferase MdoB-like AlkP superfamily enzyme